jgi:ABC-type phosphate/phosphonate transport system substrate-binding protein
MKGLFFFCILFVLGCSSESAVNVESKKIEEVDSVIAHSERVVVESFVVTEKVDSVVKHDIVQFFDELQQAKEEVKSLKSIQKIEKVRIDTVYIETKKNFWGKEKTKTTVVSDSIVLIDSLEN